MDGSLIFDTKIDSKGFQRDSNKLSNSLKGLKAQFGGLIKVAAAAFSVKKIISFTKACEEAWQVQLEAETRLEQVMKNTMSATKDQIQTTKEWASELQKIGVIGDEVTLSGLQEIGTYVENADSLKTMSVVLDDMLAQQYGLNATAENAVTISTMLGKVLEGQTSALSRYGYKFDEAQEQLLKYGTEEQRVATLAQVVEASVGGMNEALARTPAGRLKQISNSMGDVKEQFGQAVTNIKALFLPALERLAATLARVADLAVRTSQALASVFGVSIDNSAAVTSNISESVAAQEDLTAAINETAKAQKNNLAGFDKINTIATETAEVSETSGSGAQVPVELDETSIEKQIGKLEGKIQKLIEPFKIAWDNKGEELMKSFAEKWGNLKELAGSIIDAFKKAWNENNVGQSIIEHIIGAYTEYNNTIANLTKSIKEGWEENGAGTRIFSTILKIINAVSDMVERAIKATADWAADTNFAPLFNSIAELLEVLEPIGERIGEGLLWFYKNVVLPFAGWVIEKALPASIDVLTAAINALDPVVEAFMDTGKWLWENFLRPLGEWAGDIAVGGLEKLADILKDIGDYIDSHPTLKNILGPLAVSGASTAKFGKAGFIVSGLTMGGAALKDVWDNRNDILDVIKESGGPEEFNRKWTTDMVRGFGLDGVADAMEKIDKFLTNTSKAPFFYIWTDFWENIGAKIADVKDTLVNGFTVAWDKITEVWEGTKNWFADVWGGITESFSDVGDWFKDKFSTAWTNITEVWSGAIKWFSDIWEGIKETFANVGSWFKTKFEKAKTNITDLWGDIGEWFGARWSDIKGFFNQVPEWFGQKFNDAKTNVVNLWSNIGEWFSDRWRDIKSFFKNVPEWFSEKFQKAKDNITNIWSKIGEFFSGIWNDITNGLHNAINTAIEKINGLLWRMESAINSLVGDSPVIKVASALGIVETDDIPHINIPQIPYLAEGTVIPANYGNFLAMLGDNTREAEVVSPVSAIEKAVESVIARMGFGGGQDIHVHVDLDGREIGRVAVKAVNSDNARKGR